MTEWKVLSIGFLIKQLFFEKSHFLHPHAQKSNTKLKKSFTFALKKSEKNQKFHFSKNASRWLLVTPNGSLSTPRAPKHLLEAPMHPMGTSKKFHKFDFWAWKCIFQARGPPELEKTHFQSRFRWFNFINHLISWLTTLQGESIWPNEKFCRADFWLTCYR